MSIAAQKFAAKDCNRIVKADEERDVFGNEPPTYSENTNRSCGNARSEEIDKSPFCNTGTAGGWTKVEKHIKKNHTPHDRIPIGISNAKSEQETWNNRINT